LKRNYGDDQLGSVSKGCVQQAADSGPHMLREMLGRFTQDARQRDDRKPGSDEYPGSPRVGEMKQEGNGNEDEKKVKKAYIMFPDFHAYPPSRADALGKQRRFANPVPRSV
jgi:hypothetical protein